MRNTYFRYKYDVLPKGMSQKRTCHGFQSNHPTAIKMSIAFSHVDVLVCASVQGVLGRAGRNSRERGSVGEILPCVRALGRAELPEQREGSSGSHPQCRCSAQSRGFGTGGWSSSPPVP